MLEAQALSGLPEDRSYAAFFNKAHSPEGLMAGVRLAVWLSEPPEPRPSSVVPESRIALLGWMANGQLRDYWLPLGALNDNAALLDHAQYVALAHPDVKEAAPSAWKRLQQLGYSPEIDGQITGWVFESRDEASGPQPGYSPHAALLAPPGKEPAGTPCLLLVSINYAWYVLSEPGANTYSHGQILNHGGEVYFRREGARSPVWVIRKHGRIPPERLVPTYGKQVSPQHVDMTSQTRARDDAPALLVSVVPIA